MSGWTKREVAIPVAAPPPIVWAVWAGKAHERHSRGAAEHWADWQPHNQLLLLRSTIPVRTTDPQPGVTAMTRALAHWNDGRIGLGIARLTETERLLAWSWDPSETAA